MIVKFKDKPSKKYGKNPYERSFDELLNKGVVVIDKHEGPTSHMIVDMLKKILNVKKAGHSGTLDPKVTGVLVIGLGKGTKLMEYMLKSGKEYVCLMYVHKPVSEDRIRNVMKKFVGKIRQKPPVVSAVKRVERVREIYDLKIIEIKEQWVLFRTKVQHGTYIRKLCHDIGEALGPGAHMAELRRARAGPFCEEESISLARLADLMDAYKVAEGSAKDEIEKVLRKYIMPIEEAMRDYKRIVIRDSAVHTLSHGCDLAVPGIVELDEGISKDEIVGVYTLKGELVAVGVAKMGSREIKRATKGIAVKTDKVFMDPSEYPKVWK